MGEVTKVYVRADGNDEDDGLTPETAKRTVQAAMDALPAEGGTVVNESEWVPPRHA